MRAPRCFTPLDASRVKPFTRAIELVIRRATLHDVDTIVHLSNEGGPDGRREELPSPLPEGYRDAFAQIDADPRQSLMVCELDGAVVGTFHVSYLVYLAGKGRPDMQLEAVHVAASHRNRGIGAAMMEWAIAEAKRRQCRRIQLTSNKKRKDAHRFYERLGFVASHEGMKLVF